MSLSHDDILSNDQLDQIHFDPRYRDYRSSASLNNSGCNMFRERRSHSLTNFGSNELRRPSCDLRRGSGSGIRINMTPLPHNEAALAHRYDTNPSIFVEEYVENLEKNISNNSVDEKNIKNVCEIAQSIGQDSIKTFGDLNDIPFIDDDDDLAPCRYYMDSPVNDIDEDSSVKFTGIMTNQNKKPINKSSGQCRKTVSFDVITDNFRDSLDKLKLSKSNTYQYFKDTEEVSKPKPTIPIFEFSTPTECDPWIEESLQEDHCILIDQLNKFKKHETPKHPPNKSESIKKKMDYKIKWDEKGVNVRIENNKNSEKAVCNGKVKALTTYFNALKYLNEDMSKSTPNLSSFGEEVCENETNKLSKIEQTYVMQQLKEWSEFGLEKTPNDESSAAAQGWGIRR